MENENQKTILQFKVKSFKKFDDPYTAKSKPSKYQFFVNAKELPEDLDDWLGVNPREQKTSTDVAKDIKKSLLSSDKDFHMLNRGLLISSESISYDNSNNECELVLSDPEKHGIVDGGHTFKIVVQNRDKISVDKYINIEVIIGTNSIETLAEARNTSVAVDDKSIENLRGSFDTIKRLISTQKVRDNIFYSRVAFKQNEFWGSKSDTNIIDVREIIAIINMFNPHLYSPTEVPHPIQSYSGKEASLNKFLKLTAPNSKNADDPKYRDKVILEMEDIIPDLFKLWDIIEVEFPDVSKDVNRRYGSKKYSHYNDDRFKKISMFSNITLEYSIPKGIMYPLLGSFRALVHIEGEGKKYAWAINPFDVWKEKKETLVTTILDNSRSSGDSPDQIGKSGLIWDSLFNCILIHKLMSK